MNPRWFLPAVFMSGAAGLMYQTLWIRQLGFIFGNTTISVSLVLSSFFFGLAAGSLFFGRRADDSPSPIRLYRSLELGIASTAVLVMLALPLLNDAYVFLYRAAFGHSLLLVSLAKVSLTFILLCLPSFLMGGTLPVMTRCYVRSKDSFTVSLGLIYSLNTVGALVGLLAMAFILIELLGLRASYYAAVILSLLSAGMASVAATGGKARPVKTDKRPASGRRPVLDTFRKSVGVAGPASGGNLSRAIPLYLLAFLLGALSIGYEVLWVRLWSFISLHSSLTPVGRAPTALSSTYVYSFILGLYLLGISVGGVLVRWVRRPGSPPLRQLSYVQLAIGLITLGTLWLERLLSLDGLAVKLVEITAVVVPTTILMGVGFPFLAGAFVDSIEDCGRRFGAFYAANTLGCAAGPLLVGLVLLPMKGTYSCLTFLGLLHVVIGFILFALTESGRLPARTRRAAGIGVAGAVLLGAVLILPFPSVLPDLGKGVKVLFEDDNHVGHTLVLEHPAGIREVVVNNFTVSGVGPHHSFGAMSMQLPVGLLGRVPEDILVLCVGSGGSWASTLRYETARVVAVDINPAVFKAIPLIHPPEVVRGLSHPRMIPVVADARNYLLLEDRTYDIINIDPAPPITQPGMVNLHTLEFYQLAQKRLKPGGILYQRLSGDVPAEYLYKTLIKSISEVFQDVTVWRFLGGGVDIIASDRPLKVLHHDPKLIDCGLQHQADRFFIMGKKELDRYLEGISPVTDDRPVLEYHLLSRLGLLNEPDRNWTGARYNRSALLKRLQPMDKIIKRE